MELLLWFGALFVGPYLITKAELWRKAVRAAQLYKIRDVVDWWNEEAMPWQLRGTELFLNEVPIHTQFPVPLHGRVDQVFKTARGKLILVDSKSRDRHEVYLSDVIQLSAYAVILRKMYSGQYKVSNKAFVRAVVVTEEGEYIRYIPVTLLSEREVVKLHRRYTAIKYGQNPAKCTCRGQFH